MFSLKIALWSVLFCATQFSFSQEKADSLTSLKSPYPEKEMQDFWEIHLRDLLFLRVWGIGSYINDVSTDAELGAEMKKTDKEIVRLFGAHPKLGIFRYYHPDSKQILFAFVKPPGQNPEVQIILPAIIDLYHNLLKSDSVFGFPIFEQTLEIGVLHEMYHGAYGFHVENPSREEVLREEKKIWGITCEFIRILVEKYRLRGIRLKLLPSQHQIYDTWVECGRNDKSRVWDTCIRSFYQE